MNHESDVKFSRQRRNFNTGLVFGVGVNDAPYQVFMVVDVKRVRCPFYGLWRSVLRRCYDPQYQAKHPTYAGCSVAPEWHRFMAFRAWMAEQGWQGNQIDKDILAPGNRVYGPDTCVFVDQATNNLLIDSGATRGDLPLGANLYNGGYRAQCSIDGVGAYFGFHRTPAAAHHAWQQAKADAIRDAADRQPDPRVKAALHLRADWLDRDRLAGHETLDFKGNFRPFDSAQTQTNVQHMHIAPGRVWTQANLFEVAA